MTVRQPTRMKCCSPLLHAAMNVHLVREIPEISRSYMEKDGGVWTEEVARERDPEFWQFYDEFEEKIDDIWEEKCDALTLWQNEQAPQLVRDFYDQVGSLHDDGFEFNKIEGGATLRFKGIREIEISIKCVDVWCDLTAPEWFGYPYRWMYDFPFGYHSTDSFLYDEFQVNDAGELSYHFTAASGREFAFSNVSEMKWSVVPFSS